MRPASIARWDPRGTVATRPAPPASRPSRGFPVPALVPGAGRWLTRVAAAAGGGLLGLALVLSAAPHLIPVATFTVLSGSMQPTIPVGAVVVATPVPAASLHLGDVITFEAPNHPGRLITHRIRQIAQTPAGPVFTTQGDANPAPDAWELRAKAPVYRYLFHVPYLGYLIVASQQAWVRVALAIAGAAAFLLLWWRSGEPARLPASR